MHDDDPSLILIPKHLLQKKVPISAAYKGIPFKQAKIIQQGESVTLLAWGNCVELITEVSKTLAKANITCELIDLRTLVPWDIETVKLSLKKTGRLVVVQEDSITSSFGTTIVTAIVSKPETFEYLFAAPELVSRQDIHIPYHPTLEAAVLPDVQSVIAAVHRTLDN